MGESTEVPQLRIRTAGEILGVVEQRMIEGIGAVQLQQTQSGEAQMHPIDRPVMQTGDTERTPVAHSLGEHLPRVPRMLLVVPGNASHVTEMVRFLQSDAIGSRTDPEIRMETLGHGNPQWSGAV